MDPKFFLYRTTAGTMVVDPERRVHFFYGRWYERPEYGTMLGAPDGSGRVPNSVQAGDRIMLVPLDTRKAMKSDFGKAEVTSIQEISPDILQRALEGYVAALARDAPVAQGIADAYTAETIAVDRHAWRRRRALAVEKKDVMDRLSRPDLADFVFQ